VEGKGRPTLISLMFQRKDFPRSFHFVPTYDSLAKTVTEPSHLMGKIEKVALSISDLVDTGKRERYWELGDG
jgi:hypothetical protein